MSRDSLAASELLTECLDTGNRSAWTAFVKRFQPLIASSVCRVASRYSAPSAPLIDDLIQETYLRLCKDDYRGLRAFKAQHDEAIFGYIKVIATSVALDYFRARTTQKRRGEVEEDQGNFDGSISASAIEQAALIKEIEHHLVNTETERDCTIFWLYYRQGYTAKDIASIVDLGLTQKGVESCIYRLTQSLRNVIAGIPIKTSQVEKGKPSQQTLGDVK